MPVRLKLLIGGLGALASLALAAAPTLATHPRPKGATPLRMSLVPAYRQCVPPTDALVFQSNREGNNHIYWMNADGTRQAKLTYDDGTSEELEPGWSRSSESIAYASGG